MNYFLSSAFNKIDDGKVSDVDSDSSGKSFVVWNIGEDEYFDQIEVVRRVHNEAMDYMEQLVFEVERQNRFPEDKLQFDTLFIAPLGESLEMKGYGSIELSDNVYSSIVDSAIISNGAISILSRVDNLMEQFKNGDFNEGVFTDSIFVLQRQLGLWLTSMVG